MRLSSQAEFEDRNGGAVAVLMHADAASADGGTIRGVNCVKINGALRTFPLVEPSVR